MARVSGAKRVYKGMRLAIAVLLLAGLSLGTGPQHVALAAKPGKVWRVDYDRSGTMMAGPSIVYMSDNAIKIITGSYEVTASAPDWTANIYSKSLNAYVLKPAKQWRKQGFLTAGSESDDYMDPKAVLSSENVTCAGFPAKKMTWKGVEMDHFYQVRSKTQNCTVELYQTTSVPISKMQADALDAWYGVPHATGVPLLVQNILPSRKLIKLHAKSVRTVPESVSFKGRTACRKLASTMDLIKGRFGTAIENIMLFGSPHD